MSYDGNHVVCSLLWLTFFSYHNVLERHHIVAVSIVYTFSLSCFFHSPSEGRLGFSRFWLLLCICPLILDKYLEVNLPGFTVGVYFTLSETARCFHRVTGPFCIPTRMYGRVSAASHPHQHLILILKASHVDIGMWQFDFDMPRYNLSHVPLGISWTSWVYGLCKVYGFYQI